MMQHIIKSMVRDVELELCRVNKQLVSISVGISACDTQDDIKILIKDREATVSTKDAIKNHLDDLNELRERMDKVG